MNYFFSVINSLSGLVAVILLFFLVRIYLKFSEEPRLLKDFGDDYLAFRKGVPMIIPIKLFH